MLVLSRKKGESIMIGDDIELVVVGVEGDQIRIGIRAPKSVEIYRKEVYMNIQQSNQEASSVKVDLSELSKLIVNNRKTE